MMTLLVQAFAFFLYAAAAGLGIVTVLVSACIVLEFLQRRNIL